MTLKAVFLLFIIKCCQLTDTTPSYTIYASKIVKQYTVYNVLVTLHDITKETNISLSFSHTTKISNKSQIETRSLKPVNNTAAELVQFLPNSNWDKGDYKLVVVGTGELSFNQTFKVQFAYKSYVILIQSNSPIYRPGDSVQFRAIMLDVNLRPLKVRDVDDMKITIKDPSMRKVYQFLFKTGEITGISDSYGINYFNVSHGVTNDISFILGNDAPTGIWLIEAETRDQKKIHEINVNNYQSPFASVDIKLPPFSTYDSPVILIEIGCLYTFGKPVTGLATVLVSKIGACDNKTEDSNFRSQNSSITGQLSWQLDMRDTKLLNANCDSSQFNITVIVDDSVTKQQYSEYSVVKFYRTSIVAKIMNPLKKIKPGLDFRVFVKFLNIEGNQVKIDSLNELKILAHITSNGKTNTAIPTSVLKKNSYMVADFETDKTTTRLNLVLTVNNAVISNFSYQSLTECQGAFVQIKLQEPLKQLVVGDTINLIVSATEQIINLYYYIIVKEDIINSSYIWFSGSSPRVQIALLLSKEMAPDFTIVMYYYSKSQNVIAYDSIDLEVEGVFENFVNITATNATTEVSHSAKFSVETCPQSELLLVGVDRLVVRDHYNERLTERSIIADLKGSQSVNIKNIESRVNFASNAKQCSSHYALEIIELEPKSDQSHNPIRSDFRKTWLWDRVIVPSDKNKVNITATIPDSITSYQLSAISINDDNGLGITAFPIQITAFKSVFIQLTLPNLIIRNKKLEIKVIIFNYLPQSEQFLINVKENAENAESVKVVFNKCDAIVSVKSNEIKVFTCLATALSVGTAKISAEAIAMSNNITVDGEIRTINVIYEGVTVSQAKEVHLDFTDEVVNNNRLVTAINIETSGPFILGSKRVYVMIKREGIDNNWANLLKQSANNVSKNFKFPLLSSSCDSRMIQFAQQVYQISYLNAMNQKSQAEIIKSATDQLYSSLSFNCSQNRSDGSFVSWSWKGNSVSSGVAFSSMWTTALMLKSLQTFKNYAKVNTNNIYHTIEWLEKQQVHNGEYFETDPNLMNRRSVRHYGLYLSSFVYIALQSDPNYFEPNPLAISFINQIYPTLNSSYDLVIACYVFHISKHERRHNCFDTVMKRSVVKNELRYWTGVDGKPDIEITSYALLILVKQKVYTIAYSAFSYLKSQQDSSGLIGDSTQTALALEAMTGLVMQLNTYDKTMSVTVGIDDGMKRQNITVKGEDEIMQILQLYDNTAVISIEAYGQGSVVIQALWQYNSDNETSVLNNTASQLIGYANNSIFGELIVCKRYNLGDRTQSLIFEIDFPFGYQYNKNSISSIDHLDRIESLNNGTHLNVYLKEAKEENICIAVPTVQSLGTLKVNPSPIIVYPENVNFTLLDID